ncbi:hypothetical protein SNEBB_005403, partial [Seison nebaliae]
HALTNLNSICMDVIFEYGLGGTGITQVKHCGCTFESNANRYRAHIGRLISNNFPARQDFRSCDQSREATDGAQFDVTSPREIYVDLPSIMN